MTSEMKEALHNSMWLQAELQDEGLRQLLIKVVTASRNTSHDSRRSNNACRIIQTEQEQFLQQIKDSNPAFATFVDKAMVVAGALERQGKDADCNLQDWLSAKSEGALLNVALKPLPRRQPAYKPIPENELQDDNSNVSNAEDDSTSCSSEESTDASASSSSNDTSSDED